MAVDGLSSHLNGLAVVLRFDADVTFLSSRCVESSSVVLNNIEWSVKLCKDEPSINSFVNVILKSHVGAYNHVPRWTCNAQATFKLLPKSSHMQNIQKQLTTQRFTEINTSHAINAFVNWNAFFTHYVSNNQAAFEIAISTNSINVEESRDLDQITSRVHVMLPNVSRLGRTTSPEVIVRGIKWRVVVERFNDNLGVHLEANEGDLGTSSTWGQIEHKVVANFKLLTYDPTARSIIQSFTNTYYWGASKRGFDCFIGWYSFIDGSRKFILDDKANLLVEFTVGEAKSLWEIDDGPISAGI